LNVCCHRNLRGAAARILENPLFRHKNNIDITRDWPLCNPKNIQGYVRQKRVMQAIFDEEITMQVWVVFPF
jgi:hypothetical protein